MSVSSLDASIEAHVSRSCHTSLYSFLLYHLSSMGQNLPVEMPVEKTMFTSLNISFVIKILMGRHFTEESLVMLLAA